MVLHLKMFGMGAGELQLVTTSKLNEAAHKLQSTGIASYLQAQGQIGKLDHLVKIMVHQYQILVIS